MRTSPRSSIPPTTGLPPAPASRKGRIAGKGEFPSTRGTAAARAAIEDAGLKPEDIDLIILATSTPDQTFPATAVTIQAALGLTHGAALHVTARRRGARL